MLKDDFYSLVEGTCDTEGNYLCKLRLNASHEIYQAHFPGNPITPGACIVQIAKELSELMIDKSIIITEIKNLKFIHVIVPHEFPEVNFQLALTRKEEDEIFSAKVLVFAGEMVFAKCNFCYLTIRG
ncbi:MAG: hypothetical protein GX109_01490 [Bacteroidales bacterium]|nr:hypothetical protein [Bacteroidales bacterium]